MIRLLVHLGPGREMMRWMLFTRVGVDGVLDLRTWSFPNALGPLGVSATPYHVRFSICLEIVEQYLDTFVDSLLITIVSYRPARNLL